jgi:hypothetical protein
LYLIIDCHQHDILWNKLSRICASKCRTSNKAVETKVDTSVEIVKWIVLLQVIVIHIEGFHQPSLPTESGSLDADHGTEFKQSRISNCVLASAK